MTRLCSFQTLCFVDVFSSVCQNYDSKNLCIHLLPGSPLLYELWVLDIFSLANMSASESSLTVSPRWLGDKATRLAQSASPNQHRLAERLVTPVMSEIELTVGTFKSRLIPTAD